MQRCSGGDVLDKSALDSPCQDEILRFAQDDTIGQADMRQESLYMFPS